MGMYTIDRVNIKTYLCKSIELKINICVSVGDGVTGGLSMAARGELRGDRLVPISSGTTKD